jgi:hypothetical protein
MDSATNLSVELIGRSIKGLGRFRFTRIFDAPMPDGNIWQYFGCDTPAGTYGPMAGDGYYVMLRPLRPGTHHLHFHGDLPAFNFGLDITYHITVVDDDHDDDDGDDEDDEDDDDDDDDDIAMRWRVGS